MKKSVGYIIKAVSDVRSLFILSALSLMFLLSPPIANAQHTGFQPPSTGRPYVLGTTPVPNAGLRAYNESLMTGPAWWKNRRQPRYENPSVLNNPYWGSNQQ